MSTHENRLLAWMFAHGLHRDDVLEWHMITYKDTNVSWGKPRNFVHADPNCPSIQGKDSTPVLLRIEEALNHDVCSNCSLEHFHAAANEDERKQLVQEAHGLHQAALWAELASSSDHVLIGRSSAALHAMVVDEVAHHTLKRVSRCEHPALRAMKELVTGLCHEALRALPYSPAKALNDATLLAIKHRTRRGISNQLYGYSLKDNYDKVYDLFAEWLDSIEAVDEGAEKLEQLLDSPAGQLLTEKGVPLEEIAAQWRGNYLEASTMTGPAYFFASGLPSGLHSVPRGCRDQLIKLGLRGRDTVWGAGVLPRIVILWLADSKGDRETRVHLLDVEYTKDLDQDIVATAIFLMRESQSGQSDTYRKAEDAVAAALLL